MKEKITEQELKQNGWELICYLGKSKLWGKENERLLVSKETNEIVLKYERSKK